jgi:hypothetical protein
MTEAPTTLYVTPEPIEGYECWTGCLSFETDCEEGVSYTRSDISNAQIAELETARDLGIVEGDAVAHLKVISLQARVAELEAMINEASNVVTTCLVDRGITDPWAWVFEDLASELISTRDNV